MRWFLVVLGMTAPVSAEPLPGLFDVLAEIEGREVQVSGLVGDFGSYGPTLRIDHASFGIAYALPREKLKRAEQCRLQIISTEQACKATIFAEVRVVRSNVELLVFDIEFLDGQ